jgi:hypothetical protein
MRDRTRAIRMGEAGQAVVAPMTWDAAVRELVR